MSAGRTIRAALMGLALPGLAVTVDHMTPSQARATSPYLEPRGAGDWSLVTMFAAVAFLWFLGWLFMAWNESRMGWLYCLHCKSRRDTPRPATNAVTP